jgi:hypothetical protein
MMVIRLPCMNMDDLFRRNHGIRGTKSKDMTFVEIDVICTI